MGHIDVARPSQSGLARLASIENHPEREEDLTMTVSRPLFSRRAFAFGTAAFAGLAALPAATQSNLSAEDRATLQTDRKSTRLNSIHTDISRMPSSA